MNYDYIIPSMKDGIEELEKIIEAAQKRSLTESELTIRSYAMLLDVFRGYNLRNSTMNKEDFDKPVVPPKEIMELFGSSKT